MLKKFFITLLFFNFLIINCLYAKNNLEKRSNGSNPAKIILKLKSITVNKLVKDKVYIEITEYSNIAKSKEYRIPSYPKHWLAQDFTKLKNTTLWQGTINKLENKELVISLVNNYFPPLENDKPLGSIKLTLNNNKNKIGINWDNAKFKEAIQIEKIPNKNFPNYATFKMKNKKSEYIIEFSLTFEK